VTQIHWIKAVSDSFGVASDWSGGKVPGAGDDAILDAPGSTPYTVTASASATVNSIQTAPDALLDITANFSATDGTGTGANLGAIRVENGAALTLQGPVVNSGTMEIFGTVSPTAIVLGSSVTLSGAGAIFLNFAGGPDQRIVASPGGSLLTNVDNRISGQGMLGGAGMTIVNEAQGFIEAKGGPLSIDTGAHTIVNAGLIDAEGAPGDDGITPAQGTVQSPIDNAGILEIDGDGASLILDGAVTGSGRAIVAGGTLRFNAAFSQNVHFEGPTGILYLAQSANYGGVISQFVVTGGQSLDLGDIRFTGVGEASYSGTGSSGVLTVTDGTHTAHIELVGDYLGAAFTAASDGQGGTMVTAGPKALHWLGPVSANFTTAADWTAGVVPGPANDAILDASGSTRYTVTAATSQTVDSVQIAATATLEVTGAFTATTGTGSGANAGEILAANGGAFTAGGTLDNTGLIALAAASGRTSLLVSGPLTLGGHGTVALGNSYENLIEGVASGAVLTNIDNTIAGAGDLGGGNLDLVNQAAGIVDASASISLILDTGSGTAVNAGLIEATGSGGLTIRDTSVDGSSGGVILAGSGSHVGLQGADLIGGTLESTGTGTIKTYKGGPNLLDGTSSAIDNRARVVVQSGSALTIQGAIVNSDQIALTGYGPATTLTIGAAGAKLSGGGRIILGDNAENIIIGASSAATLTNVDNNLSGAGRLGAGSMKLINDAKGVIVGTLAAALVIDTGANTIVNAGTILSRGKGGVTIQSAVNNTGLLEAAGGVLTVNGAVSGTGAGAIYSGTLDFTSSFSQKVVFQGPTGELELAQSQSYGGTITGFSKTGGTSLDLRDIGFVSSTDATFSGAASGGVLTVTEGTHTAHIRLSGDYTASTFTASSDGHGGTIVVDPTTAATAHRFVAAAAALGAGGGGLASVAHGAWRAHPPVLARPAVATA